MPTVFRVGGLRFVVYPNDHPPAHVHVVGPGWVVVVDLRGPEVPEVVGPCARRDVRRVLKLAVQQFEAVKQRGKARLLGPCAIAARYDAGRGRVVITLSTGVELGLAPRDVEGLAGASAEDLRVVQVDGMGLGIHFPRLDADLYVPALLEGVLGSRRWMAARLGAAGGQARTVAEAAAARKNGRLGGRPRKAAMGG